MPFTSAGKQRMAEYIGQLAGDAMMLLKRIAEIDPIGYLETCAFCHCDRHEIIADERGVFIVASINDHYDDCAWMEAVELTKGSSCLSSALVANAHAYLVEVG